MRWRLEALLHRTSPSPALVLIRVFATISTALAMGHVADLALAVPRHYRFMELPSSISAVVSGVGMIRLRRNVGCSMRRVGAPMNNALDQTGRSCHGRCWRISRAN